MQVSLHIALSCPLTPVEMASSSSKAYWTQRVTARGDPQQRKLSPESVRLANIENSWVKAHKQVLDSLSYLAKEIDLKIALSNGKITNSMLQSSVVATFKLMRSRKGLQGRHLDDDIAILEERGEKTWDQMFPDDLSKGDKDRKGISVFSDSLLCMGKATSETEKGQRLLHEYARSTLGHLFEEYKITPTGGGYFVDSLLKLKRQIQEDPKARGDPRQMHDCCVFMQMFNEVCAEQGYHALKDVSHRVPEMHAIGRYLHEIPCLLNIGPADELVWKTDGFTEPAQKLMNIVTAESNALQYSGTPVLGTLAHKNAWHFNGDPDNYEEVFCIVAHLYRVWRYLIAVVKVTIAGGDSKLDILDKSSKKYSHFDRNLDDATLREHQKFDPIRFMRAFYSMSYDENYSTELPLVDPHTGPQTLQEAHTALEKIDMDINKRLCMTAGYGRLLRKGDYFMAKNKANNQPGKKRVFTYFKYPSSEIPVKYGAIEYGKTFGPIRTIRLFHFPETHETPGLRLCGLLDPSIYYGENMWVCLTTGTGCHVSSLAILVAKPEDVPDIPAVKQEPVDDDAKSERISGDELQKEMNKLNLGTTAKNSGVPPPPPPAPPPPPKQYSGGRPYAADHLDAMKMKPKSPPRPVPKSLKYLQKQCPKLKKTL